MDDALRQAAEWLSVAQRVVVLTGAGISRESGVPTFRDAQDGLWARYDPMELASPEGFRRNPSLVWRWYQWRRELVSRARPNPGHRALVDLEAMVPRLVVITQNVDGLHRAAGSSDVIELHGNLQRFKCFDREHPVSAEVLNDDLTEPPRCPQCGALVRPDVVWFGEMLPAGALDRAWQEAAAADLILIVGTSGLVQPAASIPLVARETGARTIEVNPDRTPLSSSVDLHIAGPAGTILPALVEAVAGLKP